MEGLLSMGLPRLVYIYFSFIATYFVCVHINKEKIIIKYINYNYTYVSSVAALNILPLLILTLKIKVN